MSEIFHLIKEVRSSSYTNAVISSLIIRHTYLKIHLNLLTTKPVQKFDSYLFLCLFARFLRKSAFILADPDPCSPVI